MKDGQILLAKRADGLLEAGKWCLLGGYADRDETTVETGIRESMEEFGWVVENLRLLRINDNPNRPGEDRQNIDFIYIADAKEKTGEPDWESAELQWFPLGALPPSEEIAFDREDSILLYKKYLNERFALPHLGELR